MEWKLRPFTAITLTVGLVLGVSLATSLAHAEAR
jgi:hypothetical protein